MSSSSSSSESFEDQMNSNNQNENVQNQFNQKEYKHGYYVFKRVKTPLGTVRVMQLADPIPEGWRVLQIQQGKQFKELLNKLISRWSIVSFKTGRLDGPGYGNQFHETYDHTCGEKFIVEMPQIPIISTFYLENIYDHWHEDLLEQVAIQLQNDPQ